MDDILKDFNVLLLDADGVWFTGTETRSVLPTGEIVVSKTRHVHDGQGLSFLRALGIQIVFVGGTGEPLRSIVEKLNSLPSAKSGAWMPVAVTENKAPETIETWLMERGRRWIETDVAGSCSRRKMFFRSRNNVKKQSPPSQFLNEIHAPSFSQK